MKSSIISLLFTATLFFQSYGQAKEATPNLKQQANQMGVAFISRDYKAFAAYTYPLILKSMGGFIRKEMLGYPMTTIEHTPHIGMCNMKREEVIILSIQQLELLSKLAQELLSA